MHRTRGNDFQGVKFSQFSPLSCTVDIIPDYVVESGPMVNGTVAGYDNTTFEYGSAGRFGAKMQGSTQQFKFTKLQNNQGYQVGYWFDCTDYCLYVTR